MKRINMILQKTTSSFRNKLLIVGFVGITGFFVSVNSAVAQSTDRDSPSLFTTREIRGEESGKANVYYYTFNAGPGEFVITMDGKTDYSFTLFRVNLFDSDANTIARIGVLGTREGYRELRRFQLKHRQTITMQIAFSENNYVKHLKYMVRLEGMVEIEKFGRDVAK